MFFCSVVLYIYIQNFDDCEKKHTMQKKLEKHTKLSCRIICALQFSIALCTL